MYVAEFQEDEIANAELEARLHASLHNEAEEEQRREEAMMKARDKVQMFDDISNLGLDTNGEDLNEINPFSPEGMAHLDYLARRKHGAGFDAMLVFAYHLTAEASPVPGPRFAVLRTPTAWSGPVRVTAPNAPLTAPLPREGSL